MRNLLRSTRERVAIPRHSKAVEFPRILSEKSRRTKRTLDILFAVVLALFALPLALMIALFVRLTSRGPVFYAHSRLGRGGRTFRVLKFRTMRVDADAFLEEYLAAHPERAREWTLTHKLKDDPRVTMVGRLLRRTSLDELPQIYNILRGDMSMVGPRPIVASEVEKYGPAYRLYTQVRPGLTGLWQVSGRNDTNYRRRVELDTEYIRNWTPARDLAIVSRTFSAVLKGRGAY